MIEKKSLLPATRVKPENGKLFSLLDEEAGRLLKNNKEIFMSNAGTALSRRNMVIKTLTTVFTARSRLFTYCCKLPAMLTHKAFSEEFLSSKTMSMILARIPVFLITNEESGLWGAAVLGQQILKKQGDS